MSNQSIKKTTELKLFTTDEPAVLSGELRRRHQDMKDIAGFKTETEEHRKAAYAIYKNLNRYQAAIRVLDSMMEQPPEGFIEFTRAKYKLAVNCGGTEQPLPGGGTSVVGVKDTDRFHNELQKLKMKYRKDILKAEEINAENERIGRMEIEDVPEPHKVPYGCFPDSVTAADRHKISFMISDNEKSNVE